MSLRHRERRQDRLLPRSLPATGGRTGIPVGSVKVLIRLLVLAKGDRVEAAAIARRWATDGGDGRYLLIANLLEER